MAKTDEKVMAFVEAQLEKNPDLSSGELQEAAKKISPSVGRMTLRQFHARYPLQVKRRKKLGTSSKKKSTKKTAAKKKTASRRRSSKKSGTKGAPVDGVNRDAIRSELLRFASDLTAAESRKDLVGLLASVDRYVDRMAKAAKKA